MTAWDAYSRADFDATKADKRAARQARQAAETGQDGLFFVATPEREPKPAPVAEQLPGQSDLWGTDNETP